MINERGIIIDVGADQTDYPYYDDKVRVRIPAIHGFGDLVSNFDIEYNTYSKDETIPWVPIIPPSLDKDEKYPMLKFKANNYRLGDIVYVQYQDDGSNIAVTGFAAKYSDDAQYNNIDISKITSKANNFPDGFMGGNSNNGSDGGGSYEGDDGSSGGGSSPGTGTSSVTNATAWKGIFGCPFASKSDYYVSAGFPKYPSGGWHSGVDLAGPAGTPVYSIGDGTVVAAGYVSGYGNRVIVKHGEYTVGGQKVTLYSLYGHFRSAPSVKVGAKVKGTQNGQAGTKLGERGTTGNSTGNHTHLTISNNPNNTYNKYADRSTYNYVYNPRDFITL